jgi:phosphatidylserine decarboxylase
MAKTIDSWLKKIKKETNNVSTKKLYSEYFFRDPARSICRDDQFLLCPCDGVLFDVQEFSEDQVEIDVKGTIVPLERLVPGTLLPKRGLVISFFLTTYDVHVLRMPITGFLRSRHISPQVSLNMSMIACEEAIIEGVFGSNVNLSFMHANQRVITDVLGNQSGQALTIVQIADSEVNMITPFGGPGWQPFCQGERFSAIRLGSQVTLIVDLTKMPRKNFLGKEGLHYEAGEPIFKIKD